MGLLKAEISNSLEGGPSYSVRHRVFRAIWNTTWMIFASWTPAPLHKWRVLLIRLFGGKVALTARVYGSARIWYPPNLIMDRFSCLGPRVNCYCMDVVTIGARTIISQGAHLCAGSHDLSDKNFQLITNPIVIGEGVWVAAEAFVGPGVSIGDNAVLGARSVLFRDVEALGIYVGNPAKLLKFRTFSK